MHRSHVVRAWKWLLAHLVIAASISYLATLLLAVLGLSTPKALLAASTIGIRHVGLPIVNQGMTLGIDEGIMFFFCNLSVALSIVAAVYCSQLLNPHSRNRRFLWLRSHLQKDCSVTSMRKIPPFADIQSSQLCLASFILLVTPYVAIITIGILAGALLGTAQLLSSSPFVALAYIMPHGIPEIAALLLACSIPVGTWMTIRPVVNNEHSKKAFRRIDRAVESQEFQRYLKMIINLLLIAGLTEAHLTLKVVALFNGS
jgi:hypothetical protein